VISSIVDLKVILSKAQNPEASLVLIVADLGALYNKASSPKESPLFNIFLL
jgi:hypothetical protein